MKTRCGLVAAAGCLLLFGMTPVALAKQTATTDRTRPVTAKADPIVPPQAYDANPDSRLILSPRVRDSKLDGEPTLATPGRDGKPDFDPVLQPPIPGKTDFDPILQPPVPGKSDFDPVVQPPVHGKPPVDITVAPPIPAGGAAASAPEINVTAGLNALTMLFAGLLVVRGRRRARD